MILHGYRILRVEPGIQALDLCEVEVPLESVIGRRLVSLDPSGEIPLDDPGERRRPVRMEVPIDGKTREIVGFLLGEPGERLERLMEGLQEKETAMVNLDDLTRAARRRVRRRRRQLYVRGNLFAGWSEHAEAPAEPHLRPGDLDENDFDRTTRPGHLLRRAGGNETLALVVESCVTHDGHGVPRRSFVVLSEYGESGCLWFDGARTGQGPFPAAVPRALLRRIEAQGRPLADGVTDPLPLPIEPVFLLRVPTDAELDVDGESEVPPLPADPRFAVPLYLVDTRAAVALPAGLPVVADVATARALLARTHDGIYVPDDDAIPGAAPAGHAGWLLAGRVTG